MKKILFFQIALMMSGFALANAQVHFTPQFQDPCCVESRRPPYLFWNLSDFECMVKYDFSDSTELIRMGIEIKHFLNNQGFNADYIDSGSIWTIFSFNRHRDILFFEIKHSKIPGFTFNLAFNNNKGRFILLKETKDIDELLSTEDFGLDLDENIFRYCWIVTMLRNREEPIKIISSLGELLLYALLNKTPPNDFDTVMKYYNEDIKIEIPKIEKNWRQEDSEPSFLHKMIPGIDTAKVSYTIARSTKIFKVSIELSGQHIISYDEKLLGETLDWCGSEFKY